MTSTATKSLFDPLELPCGVVLSSRLAKSAMSDSLGDGTGHPTSAQCRLYQRWAQGGVAVSIIGEVQASPLYCEKPGNLVLHDDVSCDLDRFRDLAQVVKTDTNNTPGQPQPQLWLQLGHAGALAYTPTTTNPKGPSALHLPELQCEALSLEEINAFPRQLAATARLAQQLGFGGVQIHAAHGFLLSQFLSPLFNKRTDSYGGDSVDNRMRLLLETIQAVRQATGVSFPVAVKLNSSDQLEGGLTEEDSLKIIQALNETSIDLIDISGGTYFPGAKNASDAVAVKGPYFVEFARKARALTTKPLMCTGGFKTKAQAEEAMKNGIIDVVGLARALVLEPRLPKLWKENQNSELAFPRFSKAPEGGITAWYTMRLTDIAEDREDTVKNSGTDQHLQDAIRIYGERDEARTKLWINHFASK
jgi:2,4-dienoyl-CoA reductase-like NADH-dependent reductase (Old Yellow Enzyme family)